MLALAPRLPAGVTRLRFRIRHSGLRLRLRDGSDARLPVLVYGERVDVGAAVPLGPVLPEPRQPAGRALDSWHRRLTTRPAT